MTIQVLIATMHQRDYSLLDRMNIQSDAVVINQCDTNESKSFEYNGCKILWINTDERGVGRSRNRAILASTADILLFADDDVVYDEGYAEKVKNVFKNDVRCSFATFNLQSLNPEREEVIVKKDYIMKWHNCLKFGAFRIAVKRETILANNLFFSLLFGGGAKYLAGEDNLFLTQCVQKKLKGIASSAVLGTVAQENSTWFKGYDERYYFDRGVLFSAMYGKMARFVTLLFEIRRPDKKIMYRLKNEFDGIKEFEKIKIGKA